MKKRDTRKELIAVLTSEIESMHHNAEISFIDAQNDHEAYLYNDFISMQAGYEIDHVNSGGAHGGQSTVDFVASQYKTRKAQRLARKLFIKRRDIEISKYVPYEKIIQYGELFQWGRSGATLAPSSLIRERCGHMQGANDALIEDGMNNADLTEAIIIVRSFNQAVKAWCNSLPDLWKEYKEEESLQSEIDAHDGLSPYYETRTVWR